MLLDVIASTHWSGKISAAVVAKSNMETRDSMTARSETGSESWVKRMVKLAVMPPGTGGAAAERMMLMNAAVMSHTADTSVPLLSATLTAANQNSTATPGLYSICPNGMPKFARRSLTPSFSIHVFYCRQTLPKTTQLLAQ